ncbi:Pectate lyase L [Colletotrichum aenigma]|uniref:Pectate lyase L n=1 Tax=Colletotrichum aenigma TaxID=1215731 RepID=UPI0018727299|nr:Pectate lyase L [Colletotrichum aenigma]KAF5519302.1 Pectate lyase L [Colletotrichum aenigma]
MLLLSTLVSCLPLALAANIYVAPTGNPTPDGSSAKPFGDIQGAINITQPGDVVILRGGTYDVLKNINITVNGTAQAPITLRAATDEIVIIDGEGLPNTPAPVDAKIPGKERGVLHVEFAQYWNFQRLTFAHGPYGVYVKDSSNLRFNQIVTRDNYESGFHMQGALSNNVISYLDSYGNRDPRNNGENADGIAIKEGKGEGNIIVGSRFWDNSDDGVDFWTASPGATATTAGQVDLSLHDFLYSRADHFVQDLPDFTGNGNGFKLGGGSAGDILPAGRDVVNCIAFGNKANGFTDNSQTGKFLFEENTSVWNGAVGFRSVNATGVLERNIAAVNRPGPPTNVTYGGQVTLRGAQISRDNSWDNSAPLLTNASFKSIDIGLVTGARNKNGKIAASDFLLPVDGAKRGATTSWK